MRSFYKHNSIPEDFTPAQREWVLKRDLYLTHTLRSLRRRSLTAYAAIIIGTTLAFIEISNVLDKQKEIEHNQLVNRISNVYTWCSKIDAVEGADKQILSKFKLSYPLNLLNCKELAEGTANSTKSK